MDKEKLTEQELNEVSGGFEPITPYPVGTRVLRKSTEGEITGTIAAVHAHDEYMVIYDVNFDNGQTYRVPHQALSLI